jgi:hypothetical protein
MKTSRASGASEVRSTEQNMHHVEADKGGYE